MTIGTEVPEEEPIRIVHGRWTVDVRGDEIADIRFDGVYLLRAVRAVVRDRDWNTVPVSVVDRHASENSDSTLVTELWFAADGIEYAASLTLRLHADELAVEFDGRALAGFERNRIGLVVLHPAADAGRAVRVEHTDGSQSTGSWPTDISAHQPFRDVAGFEWTRDGVTARLTLTGDVFETEDQRNWTDASFKTYSSPLARPFPEAVAEGARCRQGLRLDVAGRAARTPGIAVGSDDTVTVGDALAGALPPLSVGACLHPLPAPLPEMPSGFESVLLELTGDEQSWPEQLASTARQAESFAAALDVRMVTADPNVIGRWVARLAEFPVVRLGVFDPQSHVSTPGGWRTLREHAHRHGFDGLLLGGTRAHFTELNRQIGQVPADVPALTFSLTPQMHATEVPHLVDSLAMQRVVAENALRLAAGRPVFVGPVTLARRFNAVATTAAPDPAVEARRAVDPRQVSRFAGAWTLGSVASLAAAGVAGLCYYETCGPRGLFAADGTPTPAADVLTLLAPLRGRPVLRCAGPADIAAVAVLTDGGPIEVLTANLTARPRTIIVDGSGGRSQPLTLDGWAVHRSTL